MKKVSVLWLVLIQWVLAFEWLHAGWDKWSQPGFMANIEKTLAGFAEKTPYTAYGDFLHSAAVPNALAFGQAVRSGEILIGLILAASGIVLLSQKKLPAVGTWLLILALLAGALLNLNFFLAAGWSSLSTWGVNVIMGLVHLILAVYYFSNRKELSAK